jgi:sugar lactone lactonase YvrE
VSAGSPVIPDITALVPLLAVPGGRVTLYGGPFATDGPRLPALRVGGRDARVVLATPTRLSFLVPPDSDEGPQPVRLDGRPGSAVILEVGTCIASGIHQVDSPAIAPDGTVYVTCSGGRGQQTPVSVYRVHESGLREVFVTGLTNATSMAVGPDARLYVSSRFDGTVSRVDEGGHAEVVASDLGIACGLAFGPDGAMFVGDRSGTVFRVEPSGETRTLARLPPSVAAYHLAAGRDGVLFVTGPTLAPRDVVYRIAPGGDVSVLAAGFGRPQGLAIGPTGELHIVEALAGAAGLYRLDAEERPHLVIAAPSLVGAAFHPGGGIVVASNDAAWRFDGRGAGTRSPDR